MKKKPLIVGTALLFSSALFNQFEPFYGEKATTPGKYKMSYKIDGKVETAIIEVKENQTEVLLKDIVIKQNEQWSPLDNVVSLKDRDGEPLELNQVTIKHNVNTQETGLYFVKFSYKDYDATAKVTVNPSIRSEHKKREKKQYSPMEAQTKIMLNDELLQNEPTEPKGDLNTPGGADLPDSTSFGNMLSFMSGTLLYGTRRV